MRNLKLGFSIAVAIGATAGICAASAADLPARTYTKAPPPPVVAAYNWSGFYIGVNGGGAWSKDCWFSINTNTDEACNNPSGGIVGGQAGFNWQWQSLVLGIEASGDWSNLKAGHLTPNPATNPAANVILNSQVDNITTLAGRVGGAFNNVLIYGKGGAAWVGNKYNENAFGVLATVASETRVGYLAGIGAEYGILPNLSAGVEYDYIGLGSSTLVFRAAADGTFAFNENISRSVQTVTAHLNYRFNPF